MGPFTDLLKRNSSQLTFVAGPVIVPENTGKNKRHWAVEGNSLLASVRDSQ